MNNPHMCSVNMQHGGGPPPHYAMLNQTNSSVHRPPSLPGRHGGQRPHASEFMDPNARLKAMEEESESCTDTQTGCATVTGPQQAAGEGPPDGEEQEEFPGGREETSSGQDDWKRRTHVVSIPVPLGWKRVVEAGVVVYYR